MLHDQKSLVTNTEEASLGPFHGLQTCHFGIHLLHQSVTSIRKHNPHLLQHPRKFWGRQAHFAPLGNHGISPESTALNSFNTGHVLILAANQRNGLVNQWDEHWTAGGAAATCREDWAALVRTGRGGRLWRKGRGSFCAQGGPEDDQQLAVETPSN
jgi:hypothetical protein